jgi:biopolymer transport protein ExbB
MNEHIELATAIVDGTKNTLYIFSVITWTLILFKIWQYASNSLRNKTFDQAFWDAADLTEAEALLDKDYKGPEMRLAQRGFSWLKEKAENKEKHLKYQGNPTELLEHALSIQLQHEQQAMESGLTMLASIGSTAPFVGLFGTVIGIMHAMHQITASGSTSLEVVAGPIGDALVATAIGIGVAVPAVLAYNFFLRRAKTQKADLENFMVSFMHLAFSNNYYK